jgi:hypothetical protein
MVCSNVGSNVGCNVGSNVGSNVARSERGVLMVFCRIAFRCSQVFSVSGTHTCAYVCIQFFLERGRGCAVYKYRTNIRVFTLFSILVLEMCSIQYAAGTAIFFFFFFRNVQCIIYHRDFRIFTCSPLPPGLPPNTRNITHIRNLQWSASECVLCACMHACTCTYICS